MWRRYRCKYPPLNKFESVEISSRRRYEFPGRRSRRRCIQNPNASCLEGIGISLSLCILFSLSDFKDLTNLPKNTHTQRQDVPKALLPVANRPVLSYVLELLESNELKDLIVVRLISHPKQIRNTVVFKINFVFLF